jgi:hypothetical protein
MGWRDINMNRRKPPMRLAVVPVEEGQDARDAVLRKAALAAVSTLDGIAAIPPERAPFVAGYLAGFARHQALKHGLDAEEDIPSLLAVLRHTAPAPAEAIASLRFSPRSGPQRSSRASLRAEDGFADAGWLVGHLASLCGSERLLASALDLLAAEDTNAFLTACDLAADRLQTHHPTMALRFDADERAILRRALGGMTPFFRMKQP